MPVFRPQKSQHDKPKIVVLLFFLSKNKDSSKGCGARLMPPFFLQNWPRGKPSAAVPHSNTLLGHNAFSTLLVTSFFLHYLLFPIFLKSLFFLSSHFLTLA